MKRPASVLLVLLAACSGPLAVSVPKAPAPVSCGPWSMEGGGPGRASRVAAAPPQPWAVRLILPLIQEPAYRPEEYATPLVAGRLVLVGHSGRAFQAVRLDEKRVEWSVSTRGRIYTTAACSDGVIIFGDDEGDVRALDAGGRELWKFHLTYPVVASPMVFGGRVYLASADQNVFCLEASTGRPLWQYGRKFPRKNSVWRAQGLAGGDGKVFAGFSDGTVVALDAELGRVLWRAEVAREGLFSDLAAGPTFANGRVYAGALRGPIACLEAATGKEVWRQDVEAASGFAVGDDLVYLGTSAGTLLAVSAPSGAKVWETQLDGGIPTPPVLAGTTVLAGASEGSLFAVDGRTGKVLQQYDPGPGLRSQPLVSEQGVLFLSNGGALHLLR